MKKINALVVAVIGGLVLLGAARAQDSKPVTATGWFACDKCAMTRAKQGKFTATSTECSRKCIAEGAKLVFLSDEKKALWQVHDPESFKDRLGFYVRLTGAVVEGDPGTLHVDSVTVLEEVVSYCSTPPKPKG